MKRAVFAIAVILGGLVGTIGFAAEPTAEELVQALGSPDFNERELAHEKLMAIGLDARTSLETGTQSADREIRYRSLRILEALEEKDFVLRLQAFENGQPLPPGKELPMWESVRKRFGEELPVRRLFVEMTREERKLLAAAMKGPVEFEPIFDQRLQDLQFGISAGQPMPLGTAAALLLVGDLEAFSLKPYHFNGMNAIWHQQAFRSAIDAGKNRDMLRTLASDFIVRMYGPDAYTGLFWAMQCDLPRGAELARKTLDHQQNPQQHVTQHAMLALAKFGTAEDIVHLEPYFDDESVLHENEDGGRNRETQIRDLAGAVAVHLLGRQPEEFGFGKPARHPIVVFNSSTIGFFDAESRKRSFEALEALRKNGTEPTGFLQKPNDAAMPKPDDNPAKSEDEERKAGGETKQSQENAEQK